MAEHAWGRWPQSLQLRVFLGLYSNHRIAVFADVIGELDRHGAPVAVPDVFRLGPYGPYGALSVNVAAAPVDRFNFVVSHDVEPDDRARILAAGWCVDTGRTVSYGYVVAAPVFALTPETIARVEAELVAMDAREHW